jgi:hypothetical protein
MRYFVLLALFFVVGCTATLKPKTAKEDITRFVANGASYGVSRDSQYYVVFEDDSLPDETMQKLANYTSYILDYRGMYETTIPQQADYYVMISFKPYDPGSKEQYFQLSAASTKVFDATGEFKPRWWANSVYRGEKPSHKHMFAMHALAIRDFVGSAPNAYQVYVGYKPDNKIVLELEGKFEVEPEG